MVLRRGSMVRVISGSFKGKKGIIDSTVKSVKFGIAKTVIIPNVGLAFIPKSALRRIKKKRKR